MLNLTKSEKKGVRLQKWLAHAGVCSRRKAELLLNEGRVGVNGTIVTKLGVTIDPSRDHISVDGKQIKFQQPKNDYFVLYKPKGVMSTLSDPGDRRTVANYFPKIKSGRRLYPVGRLDYDVSGCLLLTNDGELAHRLTHPKYGIERRYRLRVGGFPSKMSLSKLQRKAKASEAKLIRRNATSSWWQFRLYSGKYHEVKRLWQSIGFPVDKMARISFAGISIRSMHSGQVRLLSPQEVRKLKNLVDLS